MIVVAGPLESDIAAPKGDELVLKLASLIAGKLGPNARAHDKSLTLAGARGVASHSTNLVFVKAMIDKGQLRVTADEFPVVANPWDRIRLPPPPPSAHAFAMASIDPEIRSALTPVLLEQARVRVFKHDEADVLAAACADVDGDGGMDLLLVSRSRIALGNLRANQFVPSKTVLWSALAKRAAVPMREPIATAVMSFDRVAVGTTDRAGVWLDGALSMRGTLLGLPLAIDACARPAPEASAMSELIGCTEGASPMWNATTRSFDAIALYDGSNATGSTMRAVAAREPNAKLHVRVDDHDAKTQDNIGPQIALGDLDQDGVVDLATSADSDADVLTISSIEATGPRERAHFQAPNGIRALCICPPEDRGVPTLVAVVGSEVWLVR